MKSSVSAKAMERSNSTQNNRINNPNHNTNRIREGTLSISVHTIPINSKISAEQLLEMIAHAESEAERTGSKDLIVFKEGPKKPVTCKVNEYNDSCNCRCECRSECSCEREHGCEDEYGHECGCECSRHCNECDEDDPDMCDPNIHDPDINICDMEREFVALELSDDILNMIEDSEQSNVVSLDALLNALVVYYMETNYSGEQGDIEFLVSELRSELEEYSDLMEGDPEIIDEHYNDLNDIPTDDVHLHIICGGPIRGME